MFAIIFFKLKFPKKSHPKELNVEDGTYVNLVFVERA